MATKTITAMFNTRQEAEKAGKMLVSEMGLSQATVRVSPNSGMMDTGYDAAKPYKEEGFFGSLYKEEGFFGSLKDLFVSDEDRYAYAEGMRRGAVLLSTAVDENQIDRASDVLESAGALDLDAQEATWRKSGWTGYDATAHCAVSGLSTAAMAPVAGTQPSEQRTGQDETIQVVQERLVVGKREVERGRVKVRAYVVERPVEETVQLRQETVHVDRHAVDRPATAADMNEFKERTIEARAMSEEAVVSKDVRVVEEIDIHKDSTERTETVRDTIRETRVDVENPTDVNRTAGTSSVKGVAAGTATGTAGAIDRTLNTNVSGTNPGADAPDGTPGNPSGTMASRAVDKTLGTNISGANPGNKS